VGHQLLGMQLEVFSTFIEHYPYCLGKDSWQQFHNAQRQYLDYAQRSQRGLSSEYPQLTANYKLLYKRLHEHLTVLIEIHKQQLANKRSKVKKHLKKLHKLLNKGLELLEVLDEPIISSNQALQQALEKIKADKQITIQDFVAEVLQIKKEVLRNILFGRFWKPALKLEAFGIQASLKMQWQLKWTQHMISALRNHMHQKSYNLDAGAIPVMLPNRCLQAKDYLDLCFMAKMIQKVQVDSAQLLQFLQNLHAFLLGCYESLRHQDELLRQNLGKSYTEIMRTQETLMLYQAWERELVSTQQAQAKISPVSARKLARVQCLTYKKKDYFKNFLSPANGQRNIVIFTVLQLWAENFSQSKNLTGPQLLRELQVRNASLQQRVRNKEKNLTAELTYTDIMLAKIILAMTQQPDYQLGCAWQAATVQTLFANNLDLEVKNTVENTVGLIFLGIGFTGSYYVGYWSHLLTAFHRICSAEINTLLGVAKLFDFISTRLGLPVIEFCENRFKTKSRLLIWLKNTMRWDEIGLLEKDAYLQYLSGLAVSMAILPSQYFLPLFAAYNLAFLTGHAVNYWIDRTGENMGASSDMVTAAKVLAHAAVYSKTHQQVFDYAHYYLSSKTLALPLPEIKSREQFMAEREALGILGCEANTSRAEMHEQYRLLSKRFHPDRCNSDKRDSCTREMQKITQAYTTLNPRSSAI